MEIAPTKTVVVSLQRATPRARARLPEEYVVDVKEDVERLLAEGVVVGVAAGHCDLEPRRRVDDERVVARLCCGVARGSRRR